MPKPRVRKISKNITEGSLRASIWKLALPLMIGALLQDLFTLVDLFFVGKLGYVAVAALAISGVIVSVIAMFTMGISAGTTALISHFVGKKEYGSADNVLFQTIVVSAISSFVIALIGLFGRDALLRLFGATPEILPLASAYLKITFAWSIFFFLFIGFNQALRGSGDAVTPLRVLIIANAINIVLDPLFIFGFGILPGWGVAGSAVATVISQGIGVMILLRHLIFGHSTLHLHRGIFKVNFLLIGRMVKIGFFASLEVLFRQFSILLLLRLVTSFGAPCLAAFGIGIRLRMAIMMVGFSMGTAASVLIGQNMGASLPDRAMKSGWRTLKYYEFIVAPVALIFLVFPYQIVGIFNNDAQVLKVGAEFLRFIAVTLPFLASGLILARGIMGAGDTVAPAVIAGVNQLALRIAVAYGLVYIFGMGTNGIWLGVNASDILQGLIMIWYFRKGFWKKRYHAHRSVLEQGLIAV